MPIAIGFAVMRYRLYDIDRIISRTFSYAIITIVLGGLESLADRELVGSPAITISSWVVPL